MPKSNKKLVEFDEVLTETTLHSFFSGHGVVHERRLMFRSQQ